MVHRGRSTCLIRAHRSLGLATAGHNRLPSQRANTRLTTVSIQRPAAALCHARKPLPGAGTSSRRGDKAIAKRLKAQKNTSSGSGRCAVVQGPRFRFASVQAQGRTAIIAGALRSRTRSRIAPILRRTTGRYAARAQDVAVDLTALPNVTARPSPGSHERQFAPGAAGAPAAGNAVSPAVGAVPHDCSR